MAGDSNHRAELDAFFRNWTKDIASNENRKRANEDRGNFQPPKARKIEKSTPLRSQSTASLSDVFDSNHRNARMRSIQPSLAPEDRLLPGIEAPRKFVIGLDYGTTFTSVSYSIHPIDEEPLRAFAWDVKSITNWPDAASSRSRKQVPSEIWYPSTPVDRNHSRGGALKENHQSGSRAQPRAGRGESIGSNSTDEESPLDEDQLLWGYAVPYNEYIGNTDRDTLGLIKHAKSSLLDTEYTEKDRSMLEPKLEALIKKGIISPHGSKPGNADSRKVQDVIANFLAKVFEHTKKQLIALHSYSEFCKVQFVITVPTIWSPQSSRILQAAMQDALRAAEFGVNEKGAIENLLIVSEPEAAATYIIQVHPNAKLLVDETFIILDCGGGTVDAVTYSIGSTYPLRLGREEVQPGGDACGASYLNENFKYVLEDRLKLESNLFQNGETKQSIVNRLIPDFENDYKRRIDIADDSTCRHNIHIPGLIGDQDRGPIDGATRYFDQNKLLMRRQDYRRIFEPILERVEQVLAAQLRLTFEKQKPVKKVFLVGGFGEAPSLRSHLREYLQDVSGKLCHEIKLIEDTSHSSETAVSVGAVLRALNMDKGPDRIIQSSYGFLRTEPYEPRAVPEHTEATPELDDIDGEYYLQTVVYFMVRGKTVPSKHEFTFPTYHTFPIDKDKLLCEEVLYVSDYATESHYTRGSPRNKGLQIAGKILVDMTWLRDKKVIRPIEPTSANGGIRHYKVEYELVAIIEGRDLRYEARYPAGGKVQKSRQVSIAAAFRPGTN